MLDERLVPLRRLGTPYKSTDAASCYRAVADALITTALIAGMQVTSEGWIDRQCYCDALSVAASAPSKSAHWAIAYSLAWQALGEIPSGMPKLVFVPCSVSCGAAASGSSQLYPPRRERSSSGSSRRASSILLRGMPCPEKRRYRMHHSTPCRANTSILYSALVHLRRINHCCHERLFATKTKAVVVVRRCGRCCGRGLDQNAAKSELLQKSLCLRHKGFDPS